MLFLDDSRMKNFTSSFKDTNFLNFFYKNLRENSTNQHADYFPYISLCGRERNFLRCDDRPMVFTKIVDDGQNWLVGDSTKRVSIDPTKLFMLKNGRLYHPAPFASYGLVKSALADQLFPYFKFDLDGYPMEVKWQGSNIILRNGRGLDELSNHKGTQ
ncbi:unnamed protein product, partial [Mesorhabditis belari]|uniref:Uncharacterized protein n=1 Tax=Mesorhabditis belari TaxID=2138241 RepID=A0AAF3EAB2_9BILA